jgi:epoxyqueuosine reductase QueG
MMKQTNTAYPSTKAEILQFATDFLNESAYNYIDAGDALRPELAGMRIYDAPLIGYASANDDYIASLQNNDEANLSMQPPKYWLPSAATVISVFFPYTERIRESNRGGDDPSDEWLHGRIQGQECNKQLTLHLRDALIAGGFAAAVPAVDERFWSAEAMRTEGRRTFSSNWSERHVAFASGLGTFSLSRGIITEKGMAGRLGSVITSLRLEADARPYTELNAFCIRCEQCVKNCPVHAIDPMTGKAHAPCARVLEAVKAARSVERFSYYGCGKCQVAVPCESRNPRA